MAENEKEFIKRMNTPEFKCKLNWGEVSEVYISVDAHFVLDDNLYLVEIDSGNEAKLLAGQYCLINDLSEDNVFKSYDKDHTCFVVIHFYENYNPSRTNNVLAFLKKKHNYKIKHLAFHQTDIISFDTLKQKCKERICN
jgi:hypothetical protein